MSRTRDTRRRNNHIFTAAYCTRLSESGAVALVDEQTKTITCALTPPAGAVPHKLTPSVNRPLSRNSLEGNDYKRNRLPKIRGVHVSHIRIGLSLPNLFNRNALLEPRRRRLSQNYRTRRTQTALSLKHFVFGTQGDIPLHSQQKDAPWTELQKTGRRELSNEKNSLVPAQCTPQA